MRKHRASIIKTKTEMEKIRLPKIKTKNREIRIQYSDEKKKYGYKDFSRIMKQIKEEADTSRGERVCILPGSNRR